MVVRGNGGVLVNGSLLRLGCWSLLAVWSAPSLAQGVQSLTGTYRFVRPALYFGGRCGSGPVIYLEEGALVFAANGTFTMSGNSTELCATGSSSGGSTPANANYTVCSDGTVLFDFDPTNPGTNTARMFVRPDGSVMLHTPEQLTDEATLAIGIKLSSGRGNNSLLGAYHTAKISYSNGAAGIAATNELGVLNFDGLGGCSGSVTRRTVTASGGTSSAVTAISGTYAVAPDGQMRFLPSPTTAPGAVSADGEVFFAADISGGAAWVMVGVRQGAGHTLANLQGLWGGGELELRHGVSTGLPVFANDSALLAADGVGQLTGQDYWSEQQNGMPPLSFGGAATATGVAQLLSADGRLQLQLSPSGRPTRQFDGALSAASNYLVGFTTANATSTLFVALRRPEWPTPYGTATPGTGGIAPQLHTGGGFPYPGNAAHALVVDHAPAGTFAAVLLGTRALPAPGLPVFGGTMWIDPGRYLGWLGGVTSAAGTALVPCALPASPALRGVRLCLQAAVLDAGAPQGLSMTSGLVLQLSR